MPSLLDSRFLHRIEAGCKFPVWDWTSGSQCHLVFPPVTINLQGGSPDPRRTPRPAIPIFIDLRNGPRAAGDRAGQKLSDIASGSCRFWSGSSCGIVGRSYRFGFTRVEGDTY